jgi:D-tyrosyl-tRNA(Tyr) deacylase
MVYVGNTTGKPALTMELGDYESDWRDKRRGYSLTNRPQDSWEDPIFILDFDESDED